ncbi:DUF6095 family protein [Flavobacterium sp. N2820]|jgi:hypothetical protein|uniref:DUF6095 family protein n=1 Tax=Flavobacterium sp. N2820 TaxID=2986834 RepID=UPI002224BB5D|nr:DUF6095 family protein [Flavobacterium sp. N2820]
MATNKKILVKGIRYLSGALPMLFIGPIIINSAFKNQDNPLYPYVLGLGIIGCLFAMFLIYKGIQTILKSLFDGDKQGE